MKRKALREEFNNNLGLHFIEGLFCPGCGVPLNAEEYIEFLENKLIAMKTSEHPYYKGKAE